MSDVYLFQIASQRTRWLDARQSLIAANVANANTPGFAAKDLMPFSAVLDRTASSMSVTSPMHIMPADTEANVARPSDQDAANAVLSGNSVNLEQEMIKLGDVGRDYGEVNGIKRAFHQMLMSAIK